MISLEVRVCTIRELESTTGGGNERSPSILAKRPSILAKVKVAAGEQDAVAPQKD
jgi:hypothetical protein